MRFQTLPEWLDWQESLHFTAVDPGLERMGRVWNRLTKDKKLPFKVITVAGTNGKGSSVALLESILRAAGYKTGTYTSPHVLSYNERICINNIPCADNDICVVFNQIDQARSTISLTYFEFATLAAIEIFKENLVDIAILEVGLGGRLDAVNLFDPDIALITPISLDHTSWLGDTRELIGAEKAGILRGNTPVVCSERAPPESVLKQARMLNAPIYNSGNGFNYEAFKSHWNWSNSNENWEVLAKPALEGSYQIQNAAAVLQVVSLLNQHDFSISRSEIETGLTSVKLIGRFQRIAGDIDTILDVTHNEQGAKNLATLLVNNSTQGHTFAVLGMLKDKDAITVGAYLNSSIDHWYVGGLEGDRGMSAQHLAKQLLEHINMHKIHELDTVVQAYQTALAHAEKGDRLIVFGSFHTVEAVLRLISLKV